MRRAELRSGLSELVEDGPTGNRLDRPSSTGSDRSVLVLVAFAVLLLAGCKLDLDEFPRAFACDRNGADGGQQCAAGWSCGYDQKCFRRRLAPETTGVENWQCTTDDHCPDDWRCGQEVDGERFCQALGVGAPSPCVDNAGCEGGWRCGSDQRCVSVTDVLFTGGTATLSTQRLNPRHIEPAPRLFAMTPLAMVPRSFAGGPQNPDVGVLMASLLVDGGVRVTSQPRDNEPLVDAGIRLLLERVYPLPAGVNPAAVVELAAATDGVAMRLQDGRGFILPLGDAGTSWIDARPGGGVTLLRQDDPKRPEEHGALVVVAGSELRKRGELKTVPAAINEVLFLTEGDIAFTAQGGFLLFDGGMPFTVPASVTRPSQAVSVGVVPNGNGDPFVTLIAEVPYDGGVTGFTSITRVATPMGESWEVVPPSLICPEGNSPVQFSAIEDGDRRVALLARCRTESDSPYPVRIPLTGMGLKHEAAVEDPLPFLGDVVPQRTGALVRAHASRDGRVWNAMPPTQQTSYDAPRGSWPLRPLVLDRQPTAMVSFFEKTLNASRIVVSAGTTTFFNDLNGGFISQLGADRVTPLGVVQGADELLVSSTGVISTSDREPRFVATLPMGETLQAPASGAAAQLLLDGAPRLIVLVSSGDSVWAADVTDALKGRFAQPASLTRVLVPVPGVRLRSLTLEPSSSGLSGYVTTNSQNLRFSTDDLERWALTPVRTPATTSLPLAVWAEPDGGAGRTGFSDGRVWSLPVMVELTQSLTAKDGGVLRAEDFARKCGDTFVATAEGVFRAEATPDGGLPHWSPLTAVNASLDSLDSLRLYESHDVTDRLFVGTKSGLVIEVTGACR